MFKFNRDVIIPALVGALGSSLGCLMQFGFGIG